MSAKSSFSLVFYINRTKARKNGACPVMMRININGQKVALHIKRVIMPDDWDTNRYQMKGKTASARVFNDYIEALRLKTLRVYNELLNQHHEVSPNMLRDAVLGINSAKPKMLLEIWNEHNEGLKKLIGKENSYATYQKFTTARNHVASYLLNQYQLNDISIKQLNYQFIINFSLYLKSEKNIGNNTTTKFLQNFKKIVTIAKRNGWIQNDPFDHIQLKIEEVDRPYLTEKEMKSLMDLQSPFERLNKVRDLFIFSCFTGLAYIDMKQLTKKEIEQNEQGLWIKTHRQKTGVRANIPLLEVPQRIMNRYANVAIMMPDDPLLPMLSNQKLNAYLKELADICGIKKQLTFHVARHTFATTVTMTNGVPIESVSKMLGHKKIATTQHYARIVDQKVGEDMGALAQKLQNRF